MSDPTTTRKPTADEAASTRAYCAALAKLQAAGPMIVAPRSTGQTGNRRYAYADLGDVMCVIQPRLADAGLLLMQTGYVADGQVYVTTRLTTDGANGVASTISTPIPTDADRPAQALGGLITYLRRYGVLLVTGAVVAEDDDDAQGQGASKTPTNIRRYQTKPDAPARAITHGSGGESGGSSTEPEHVTALRAAMKRACEALHGGDIQATVAAHLTPRGLARVTDAVPSQAAAIALEIDEAIAA